MPRPLAATLLVAMCNVLPRVRPVPPPLQAIYSSSASYTQLQGTFQNAEATTFSQHNLIPSSQSVPRDSYTYTTNRRKMSQEQPRRPQPGKDPIKYGDVFHVSGDLAQKPVAPEDAAMMQSAESRVLGQTQPGGAAAVMQSAATRNEQAGIVGHRDVTDVTGDRGVTVTETQVPGRRIVTESVGGQVVGKFVEPTPVQGAQTGVVQESAITIGEALEATAQTVGDKPVDQSDASAIQAAEVRATGNNVVSPGGLAAMAQSAAAYNAECQRDQEKIKIADVLRGATAKLPADKAATLQDAEGVASAEVRNNPDASATPGGVAASVAAAARLNENVNV